VIDGEGRIHRAPGSRGAVVFLTGLSGSGKSTIAEALAADLRAAGREVEVIDGDVLRQQVSADLGYDAASREANIRRAAELAARFAADGQVAITALIAPFERSRRAARELIQPSAPFLLVYVSTPLELAEARDPKGLYRRARAGEILDFTGIDSPYEPPDDADLVIETAETPVAEAVRQISEALEARIGTSA
jgi:sulfate adenylyltransferase